MDPYHAPRLSLEPDEVRWPRLLIQSENEKLQTGRAQLDGRDVLIAAATIDLEAGRVSRATLKFDLLGGIDLELPANVTVVLEPCAPGLLEIAQHSSGTTDGLESVKRVAFVPSIGSTPGRLPLLNVLATLPDEAFALILSDLAADAGARKGRETRGFPVFDAFELLESVARRALADKGC